MESKKNSNVDSDDSITRTGYVLTGLVVIMATMFCLVEYNNVILQVQPLILNYLIFKMRKLLRLIQIHHHHHHHHHHHLLLLKKLKF